VNNRVVSGAGLLSLSAWLPRVRVHNAPERARNATGFASSPPHAGTHTPTSEALPPRRKFPAARRLVQVLIGSDQSAGGDARSGLLRPLPAIAWALSYLF
jgi:hypothetical protein